MLKLITEDNYHAYINQAYQLSLSLETTAFPIFCDGLKTKKDFVRWVEESFERTNEYIIGLLDGNSFKGWLHYFTNVKTKNLSICTLLVEKGQEINELINYLHNNYKAYEFNLYVPHQNKDLITQLKKHQFKQIDKNYVEIMNIDKKQIFESDDNILRINKDNFNYFLEFRNSNEASSYWSNKSLLEQIDQWIILMYTSGKTKGAVYAKKSSSLLEIFGIEPPIDNQVVTLLIQGIVREAYEIGVKNIYLFADENEHKIIKRLGFETITEAYCFSKKL